MLEKKLRIARYAQKRHRISNEDRKTIFVKNIKARNLHIFVWARYKHKQTVSRCIL